MSPVRETGTHLEHTTLQLLQKPTSEREREGQGERFSERERIIERISDREIERVRVANYVGDRYYVDRQICTIQIRYIHTYICCR